MSPIFNIETQENSKRLIQAGSQPLSPNYTNAVKSNEAILPIDSIDKELFGQINSPIQQSEGLSNGLLKIGDTSLPATSNA